MSRKRMCGRVYREGCSRQQQISSGWKIVVTRLVVPLLHVHDVLDLTIDEPLALRVQDLYGELIRI